MNLQSSRLKLPNRNSKLLEFTEKSDETDLGTTCPLHASPAGVFQNGSPMLLAEGSSVEVTELKFDSTEPR